MKISTIHDFGSITCVKKIKVDWGERQDELWGAFGSGDVQEIRCTYYGLEAEGKQYAISGWFGRSQALYGDWYSALRAMARKHNFSYEIVKETSSRLLDIPSWRKIDGETRRNMF